MRILHVTTASSPIAGAERVLIDLCQFAEQFGWELDLFTLELPGDLQKAVEEHVETTASAEVTRPWQAPLALGALVRYVRQREPDILHTHLHHASILGAAAAKAAPSTVLVHTRHYSDLIERFGSRLERSLDRWAARQAVQLGAVSPAAEHELVSKAGVDPSLVQVVWNGVDCDRFSNHSRQDGRARLSDLGVQGGPITGCLASDHPRKGYPLLLQAFRAVVDEIPEAQLVILGKGTDGPNIQGLVQEHGLEGNVHPLGFQPAAEELFPAFDLYVQPSIEEGFGLAVIEAMASRLPVIATEVGGMRYTVEDGVTGLHVPPEDSVALAQAMIELLRDPSARRKLGEAGERRARERFSARRMAEDYAEMYEIARGRESD